MSKKRTLLFLFSFFLLIHTHSISYGQAISIFPYEQDFELGTAGFTSGGTSSSWANGTPAKAFINSASSGTRAWVNGGLGGVYNLNETSWVKSPFFDFSSETDLWISMNITHQSQTAFDGSHIQYSTDSGATWITLGNFGDPYNWYTNATVVALSLNSTAPQGWTGTGSWRRSKHALTALMGEADVLFRVLFSSDGFTVDEGFAFDDFTIGSPPPLFLGNDTTICGSYTLDPGYTVGQWSWSNGDTTPSSTITNPGPGQLIDTISLTYTDLLGLCSMDTIILTINPLPVPDFTGLNIEYCESEPSVFLTPIPGAGIFSASGMVGSAEWDPGTAGVGTDTVWFTYTDANGCTEDTFQVSTVNPLPFINISGLNPTYCENGAQSLLTLTPGGGGAFISGPGVIFSGLDVYFNPTIAGSGDPLIINYTQTDPVTGCVDSVLDTTEVFSATSLSISNLAPQYCTNTLPDTLSAIPSGGLFVGNGIVTVGLDFVYDPSIAGYGSDTVLYIFTDGNLCTDTLEMIVWVDSLTPVSLSGLTDEHCINGPSLSLSGTPIGGTFTGDGIAGGSFYLPVLAGLGPDTIRYSFTDPNGCTNWEDSIVMVHDTPNVVFTGLMADYCEYESAVTLVGSPLGGFFSGSGISGSTFTPSSAGVGTHTISYVFTDLNGCTNIHSRNVTINSRPIISFSGLNSSYCVDEAGSFLVGSPGGGTFGGPGVSGTSFIPSVAGAGTHSISYSFTDVNGCSDTLIQSVTVNPLPFVTFAGLNSEYCIDAGPSPLTGVPSGGFFTGSGIFGSLFIPDSAGLGTHNISYTFVDGNGCINSNVQSVIINALPTPSIVGLDSNYCDGNPVVAMTGLPIGGLFTGNGVFGNLFIPDSAGVGPHMITYTYTDTNGCVNTSIQNTIINSLPNLNIFGLGPDYCIDEPTVVLAGSPGGGIFSGPGISGTSFNPFTAGVGSHSISYFYMDGNGCTNSLSQGVMVNSLPNPTFSGLGTSYCLNEAPVSLSGVPLGGIFSGQGVSGNTFNPTVAGTGTHSITYTYTDGNGCTQSSTKNVVVHSLPMPTFSGLLTDVCEDAGSLMLSGNLSGGLFSGTGITDSTFIPSIAGIGIHSITYTYTDGNGCTNSQSQNTEVHSPPSPNFSGMVPKICINDDPLTLGGSPLGGLFLGSGVVVDQFFPSVAGVGFHPINYYYTDGFGCTGQNTQLIEVQSLPSVSFGGLSGQYCEDANPANLLGFPSGGFFTGPGVNLGSFDPPLAGPGTHAIVYTFTDINGCTNNSVQTTVVNPLPLATFGGLEISYCEDEQPATLIPNPGGGFFFGNGVSGTTFDAGAAGAGIHTITYFYSDANGCSNTTTQSVTVNPIPTVSFSNLNSAYCLNEAESPLIGSPNGGVFSGPGISGSNFYPDMAGIGVHLVTYTYTEITGCKGSHSSQVIVNALPIVGIGGLDSAVCIDHLPLTISGVPAGGVFDLSPGLSGSTFSPAVAGLGTHSVSYTFTDSNGCNVSTSEEIIVNLLPTVSFSGLDPEYCLNDTSVTLLESPVGGTFINPAINGNTFTPSMGSVGFNNITYTFTDANGCSNEETQITEILTLPNVLLTGLASTYCEDNGEVILSGTPANGTFWGTGVETNMFHPEGAGVGIHSIYYEGTNLDGCSNTASLETEVLPLPEVSMFGVNEEYCEDAPSQILTGLPFGGIFSGDGVVGDELFPNFATTGTGSVIYQFTDGNGCTNQTSSTFYVNALPTVDLGDSYIICDEGAFTIDAGNTGSSFLWSTGEVSQSIEVAEASSFSVTVTDANGCKNSASKTTEIDSLMPITVDTMFCPAIQFSASTSTGIPTTYFWDFADNGNTSTTQNPTYNFTSNGLYLVTLTANNECGTRSETEFVNITCMVGVAPEQTTNFALFPNPTQGIINIESEEITSGNWNISLVNIEGKVLESRTLSTNSGKVNDQMDLTNKSNGIYFLRMESQGEYYQFKILKD